MSKLFSTTLQRGFYISVLHRDYTVIIHGERLEKVLNFRAFWILD